VFVADRLAQDAADQFLFGQTVKLFGPAGEHDDFHRQALFVHAVNQAQPILQFRQAQIHHQHVRAQFHEQAAGFRRVVRHGDFVTGRFEQQFANPELLDVVVGYQ